ncbi:hypothetical protein Pelo_11131 [Pelomyxa schiedti]|nr:hypothetical protein Pelo_11131 [Pelomyxa schiedti]
MRFAFVLLAIVGSAVAWTCTCSSSNRQNGVCTNIPSDSLYYLTSFCDQETACGESCGNCSWAYSTSAKRFGCNASLKCCSATSSTMCTTLKVIDSGPACWVEDDANMPIIDASYSTCKYFTGSTSCGYSDEVKIKCSTVSAPLPASYIHGPCYDGPAEKAHGLPVCPN